MQKPSAALDITIDIKARIETAQRLGEDKSKVIAPASALMGLAIILREVDIGPAAGRLLRGYRSGSPLFSVKQLSFYQETLIPKPYNPGG
uniref:Uncharacterized protein n=1 Tax=Amphimedon queenslandica TaxID=400682 RepID=A0A1X7T7P6_AMPQE